MEPTENDFSCHPVPIGNYIVEEAKRRVIERNGSLVIPDYETESAEPCLEEEE